MQRDMLAAVPRARPEDVLRGQRQVGGPRGPASSTRKQPPYRLSVATTAGETPDVLADQRLRAAARSRTSRRSCRSAPTRPTRDATASSGSCGCPDTTQVPGPSQIANQFSNDPTGRQTGCGRSSRPTPRSQYGNLLTLPVGGGLLYVQPLYTPREGGSGNYPVLRFVLASFGRDVGIGSTLDAALADVLAGDIGDDDHHDRRADRADTGRHPGPAGGGPEAAAAGRPEVRRGRQGAQGRRPRGLRQGRRRGPGPRRAGAAAQK